MIIRNCAFHRSIRLIEGFWSVKIAISDDHYEESYNLKFSESDFQNRAFVKKRSFPIQPNPVYSFYNEKIDLFILAFFLGPLLAAIIFESTLYNGWRHLYFIYPSFLMMSMLGLHIIKILFFKKILLYFW